jgi:lipoprotein-anchoring transpeptidase ErfK/SrfK
VRSRFFTEDGFPNVYLFLRRWTNPHGRTWVHVRIPMRPNGKTGWIREDSFGPVQLVRTRLVVDRRRLRATLYRRGHRIWGTRIGVGKPGTPTPAGHFWIRELFRVTPPGGLYGPWAFGTSDYSTLSDWPKGGVIGIHGTNEPGLIPGRPSHGCIRMLNAAITQLAHRMPIGTPVLIR